MKKQRLSFCFFCMTMLIIVSGCGNKKLTRPEAETLIKQKLQLPKDDYNEFNNSELKKSGYYFKSISEGKEPFYTGESRDFPKSELFSNFESNGLITITTQLEESMSNLTYYYDHRYDFKEYYIANLTEKSRPLVNGNLIKVASLEFGEITGIIEGKESSISEVQYTIKRTNITPFGNALNVKEEIFNRTEIFTKYDDGWRISN